MPERRVVKARGGSMGPFIPAGSELVVERVDSGAIQPGDVLCFIDAVGNAIAHRVVSVQTKGSELFFEMRGDVQIESEIVPAQAVLYRVQRVIFHGISYSTSGAAGRALSRVALGDNRATDFFKSALNVAWRNLRLAHQLVRKEKTK